MLSEQDVTGFARKVNGAAQRVVRDYRDGDAIDEESFSDQLCGRIKETLEGFETDSVSWQAENVLRDRRYGRLSARSLSKHSEEPAFGADLVVVLDIDLPDYEVNKGFLAQAKRLEVDDDLAASERKRLVTQCDLMTEVTPASLVLLYGSSGLRAISATAVSASRGHQLDMIPTAYIEAWFRELAICGLGDRKIQATDPGSLLTLAEELDTEAALRLIGRSRRQARPLPMRRRLRLAPP